MGVLATVTRKAEKAPRAVGERVLRPIPGVDEKAEFFPWFVGFILILIVMGWAGLEFQFPIARM